MFAYIEILTNNQSTKFGYSNFSFSKSTLTIKPLKGATGNQSIHIPISEITNIEEDNYFGWNQVKFDFEETQFIFLYSGYGEYDYLKENLMTAIMA